MESPDAWLSALIHLLDKTPGVLTYRCTLWCNTGNTVNSISSIDSISKIKFHIVFGLSIYNIPALNNGFAIVIQYPILIPIQNLFSSLLSTQNNWFE